LRTLSEYFQAAVNAHRTGRLGDAESICLQLLQLNPLFSEVLGLLEAVYSAQGRPAEIIPLYQKALTQARQIITVQSTDGGLRRLRTLGFIPEGILDIGAYEGAWMRMAKTVFPESKVLMVEAQPEKEPLLSAACKAYNGSVKYLITLLGQSNQEAVPFFQMRTQFGSTGSSVYEEQVTLEGRPLDRQIVALKMIRLDDLPASHSARHFQLIKLDVQGAELDVLSGGSRILHGAEAVLLEVSFVEYNKGAPQFADVVAFMNAKGFVVFDILDCYREKRDILIQSDILFVRKDSPLRPAGLIEL
jgi:FkbM family methyltransferase